MPEETMPTVEAEGVDASERASYELAFHVLPTIVEGEVATVFQNLKDTITTHGGEVTLEEAPARFDLAYEIEKYLEGRYRKFGSAYFGWVRFTAAPSDIEAMGEAVEAMNELLRYMFVRLTKVEEAHPFYFHEALAETASETIDLDEEKAEEKQETPAEVEKTEDAETESTETTDSSEDGEESKDKV